MGILHSGAVSSTSSLFLSRETGGTSFPETIDYHRFWAWGMGVFHVLDQRVEQSSLWRTYHGCLDCGSLEKTLADYSDGVVDYNVGFRNDSDAAV